MSENHDSNKQGHWILAKMGKKVLRPGGKELTEKLIEALNIQSNDSIVEFAPGLGFTANLALKKNPRSYVGIELNPLAVAQLQKLIHGENRQIHLASADASKLPDHSQDKVFGEAMLTMQSDPAKSRIIQEARRILKPGGIYAIHELALTPNQISADDKTFIQRELAETIRVNARPLTENEWIKLLTDEGFTIKKRLFNPMKLLELKRMIDDEGVVRTLKIIANILRFPNERKQILRMKALFHKYRNQLTAIAIIAEKN